jgi:hypothetical protein
MNFINKYFFNFNHTNVPVGSPSSATSSPSAKALMIMNNVHEEARSFSVFGPTDYTGKQHKKANNILNQFYSQSPNTSETLNRDHYSHLTNSEYLSPVKPDESLETHKELIVHDKDDEEGEDDDEEDDSDSETRRPSFTTAASVEDSLTLDLNLVNNSSSSLRITDKPLTSREKVPCRKLKPRVSPSLSSSSPSPALPPTKDLVNFNSVLINRNEFDLLLTKKLNQCQKQQQPPPKQPSKALNSNTAVAQGPQNNRFVDPDQKIYFGLNFSPHSAARKSPQGQQTALLSPWSSSPSPLPKLNERKRENNTTTNNFSIFSPSSSSFARSSPTASLPPVMLISEVGVFFCPEGISRQPFTPVRLASSSYSPSRGVNSSFSPSFTSFFRASSASSSSSNSSSLLYLSRTPTRPVLKRNHDQLQQTPVKTISPFSPLEYSPTPANSPVRDRPTKMRNVAK